MNTHLRIGTSILSMIFLFLLYSSCDKSEETIQKDSERLMRDLKGNWSLVSVREIVLTSSNNGYSWVTESDKTYPATGQLNVSSIEGADYSGSLAIQYDTIDEAHNIYGNAYKNTVEEKIWINTGDQSNIQSFLLYDTVSSQNVLVLYERDENHFLLWIQEIIGHNSKDKEKFFEFEKAR